MMPRPTLLAFGILAACAGVARAQDAPPSPVDPKALCGLLRTEPGEPVKTGTSGEELKKLLGDVPSGATCTVTLREAESSTVSLTLLGLPRGSELGCRIFDQARRKLAGEGLTARPTTFDYGIRGAVFVEIPPEDSMLPLGMVAMLACDVDFTLIGIAGAEARRAADLDDEIELLRRRIRRALGGVVAALGRAPTLASSEKDFVQEILPAQESFYARWRGGRTDCLTEARYRYCGQEEASDAFGEALAKYPDADPALRPFLALAEWRYPSGERVAPSIAPVLPVIQRLVERAASDPAAEVAVRRFVALTVRMDAEAAGGTPTVP